MHLETFSNIQPKYKVSLWELNYTNRTVPFSFNLLLPLPYFLNLTSISLKLWELFFIFLFFIFIFCKLYSYCHFILASMNSWMPNLISTFRIFSEIMQIIMYWAPFIFLYFASYGGEPTKQIVYPYGQYNGPFKLALYIGSIIQ